MKVHNRTTAKQHNTLSIARFSQHTHTLWYHTDPAGPVVQVPGSSHSSAAQMFSTDWKNFNSSQLPPTWLFLQWNCEKGECLESYWSRRTFQQVCVNRRFIFIIKKKKKKINLTLKSVNIKVNQRDFLRDPPRDSSGGETLGLHLTESPQSVAAELWGPGLFWTPALHGSSLSLSLHSVLLQLHLIHWNSTLFNTLDEALGKRNGILIIALFVQVPTWSIFVLVQSLN